MAAKQIPGEEETMNQEKPNKAVPSRPGSQ